jgi:hypothetical protein
MVERGGGLGFANEALLGLFVGEQVGGARNLSATVRSSFVSWALQTTPMPPSPSFSVIS